MIAIRESARSLRTLHVAALLTMLCILSLPSLLVAQEGGCCPGLAHMCDECLAVCEGFSWVCNPCPNNPIVVDLRGDKFSLTNAADGVWFDMPGRGTKKKTAWTAANSDDGFLVLDRNGNGIIDNGTELFGNFTSQPPIPRRNGFLALAVFDKSENGGNDDGMIDSLDAVYGNLRIWVDRNHNGISEAEEFITLSEADIFSMDLHYQTHKFTDEHGNEFRYRARLLGSKKADIGKWAYDVFLVKETNGGLASSGQRLPFQSGAVEESDLRGNKDPVKPRSCSKPH